MVSLKWNQTTMSVPYSRWLMGRILFFPQLGVFFALFSISLDKCRLYLKTIRTVKS